MTYNYYERDERVCFIAQRDCVIRGLRAKAGDVVEGTLAREWSDDEGIGLGGPWGWGGYTTQFVSCLLSYGTLRGMPLPRRKGGGMG